MSEETTSESGEHVTTVYQQGINAYRDGVKVERCPYAAGVNREKWVAGWVGEHRAQQIVLENERRWRGEE